MLGWLIPTSAAISFVVPLEKPLLKKTSAAASSISRRLLTHSSVIPFARWSNTASSPTGSAPCPEITQRNQFNRTPVRCGPPSHVRLLNRLQPYTAGWSEPRCSRCTPQRSLLRRGDLLTGPLTTSSLREMFPVLRSRRGRQR